VTAASGGMACGRLQQGHLNVLLTRLTHAGSAEIALRMAC
jgi:hypothetical protein